MFVCMRLRSITEADLDRVLACTSGEPIGLIDPGLLRQRFADGQYRPGLTWIAENRGQILARAVWWLPLARPTPGHWTACWSTIRCRTGPAWR